MNNSSQRILQLLHQLEARPDVSQDISQLIEKKIEEIFSKTQLRSSSYPPMQLLACLGEADPGEPQDRFVQMSRSLQTDNSMGVDNFGKSKRKRNENPDRIPRLDSRPIESIFDPRIQLGAAALGLALSLLPSSSPVSRSIVSRAWPNLLQVAIAYLIYIRKQQDLRSDIERSNGVLYIVSALIQFFTAVRDFKGHTPASFASRTLLGPLDGILVLIKQIVINLPSFLFRTVFLSGISLIGKISIIGLIAVSVVVALGLLIVVVAENL